MCGFICKDKITVLDEEVSEHASVMCCIQQEISFSRVTFEAANWTKVMGNDQAMVNIKIVFELLVGNQNIKPCPKGLFRQAQFLAPANGANK